MRVSPTYLAALLLSILLLRLVRIALIAHLLDADLHPAVLAEAHVALLHGFARAVFHLLRPDVYLVADEAAAGYNDQKDQKREEVGSACHDCGWEVCLGWNDRGSSMI